MNTVVLIFFYFRLRLSIVLPCLFLILCLNNIALSAGLEAANVKDLAEQLFRKIEQSDGEGAAAVSLKQLREVLDKKQYGDFTLLRSVTNSLALLEKESTFSNSNLKILLRKLRSLMDEKKAAAAISGVDERLLDSETFLLAIKTNAAIADAKKQKLADKLNEIRNQIGILTDLNYPVEALVAATKFMDNISHDDNVAVLNRLKTNQQAIESATRIIAGSDKILGGVPVNRFNALHDPMVALLNSGSKKILKQDTSTSDKAISLAAILVTLDVKPANMDDLADAVMKNFIKFMNDASAIMEDDLKSGVIAHFLNKKDSVSRAALKKFKEALAKLETVSKVHVLRSWLGDLSGHWSEGYQCSATNAMRNKCKNLATCNPYEVGGKLDTTKLCGYNPAPYVSGPNFGLAVRYVCIQGGPETWGLLAREPLIDPETDEKFEKNKIYKATLRSGAMAIYCPSG